MKPGTPTFIFQSIVIAVLIFFLLFSSIKCSVQLKTGPVKKLPECEPVHFMHGGVPCERKSDS